MRKALLGGEDPKVTRDYIPDSAALRTRLQLAENRAQSLKESLGSFRIVEEYHELESEAGRIQTETSVISDQNTIDRQILTDLEHALSAGAPAGFNIANGLPVSRAGATAGGLKALRRRACVP